MRSFALSELSEPLAARMLGVDAHFDAVSTDSRSIQPGELYVALSGENFDGHCFVARVSELGACAALVSRPGPFPIPVLQVDDTRRALGQLGALNRLHFTGELVAITGSCGKTTVKNMLSAILQNCGETLATAGNFNNEIGLPLTLLRLQPQHRYAVLEMGASRAGDISYLCELAQPTVTVVLNALPAHLQGFGSVDDVARAKGEILSALDGRGTAVFNADSEYAPLWRKLAGEAACLEFGFGDQAAIRAVDIETTAVNGSCFTLRSPAGELAIRLSLSGRHNIANALAAAAAALAVGASLEQVRAGLADLVAEPGRLDRFITATGATVLDDSYNANPGSTKVAIDVLAGNPGRRWLVLGAMSELGEGSASLHAEVGRYARAQGIDLLWGTGGNDAGEAVSAFGESGRYFDSRDELAAAMTSCIGAGDVVLVKGSRSAGMESVVAALRGDDGGGS
jgi:UDP-N-acetylmuramoyl-tripeptide--D-alanyl-D-alanine ligase